MTELGEIRRRRIRALEDSGFDGQITFTDLTVEQADELVELRERQKRWTERERQIKERAARRKASCIERALGLIFQEKHWVDARGTRMSIRSMTPNHARNSYNMVLEWDRLFPHCTLQEVLEFDKRWAPSAGPSDLPLARALKRQSERREMPWHRRRDAIARAEWQKRVEGKSALAALFREGQW